MSIQMSASVLGASEAIKSLRKIDPEVRRQFTKDAKAVAAPIIDEAVREYPPQLLSGMARVWRFRGRQLFPYDRAKAVRGLKVKVDTRKRAESVIKIVQSDPAAAIFETAGKGSPNRLARNLDAKFRRPSRLVWPIAERALPAVVGEMETLVLEASRRVQKEL